METHGRAWASRTQLAWALGYIAWPRYICRTNWLTRHLEDRGSTAVNTRVTGVRGSTTTPTTRATDSITRITKWKDRWVETAGLCGSDSCCCHCNKTDLMLYPAGNGTGWALGGGGPLSSGAAGGFGSLNPPSRPPGGGVSFAQSLGVSGGSQPATPLDLSYVSPTHCSAGDIIVQAVASGFLLLLFSLLLRLVRFHIAQDFCLNSHPAPQHNHPYTNIFLLLSANQRQSCSERGPPRLKRTHLSGPRCLCSMWTGTEIFATQIVPLSVSTPGLLKRILVLSQSTSQTLAVARSLQAQVLLLWFKGTTSISSALFSFALTRRLFGLVASAILTTLSPLTSPLTFTSSAPTSLQFSSCYCFSSLKLRKRWRS